MVKQKNQTKKEQAVEITHPRFLRNGNLSVALGANGNKHRVTISEQKLPKLEKENPVLYAMVSPLFEERKNATPKKGSSKKAAKPKQPKKDTVKAEVEKLNEDYHQALQKKGIEYTIEKQDGYDSILVGDDEIARVRHKNVFSVWSRYNDVPGKVVRPTGDMFAFVTNQLENREKMPAKVSRHKILVCPVCKNKVSDLPEKLAGDYTCGNCNLSWTINTAE